MKFRKKPVVIEAITFDELVQHGISSGGNVVGGMPWSFTYAGQPISHENDGCYLIPTLEGTMKMGREDMLITGVKGEIYPCKRDIFAATYVASDEAGDHLLPAIAQLMLSAETCEANAPIHEAEGNAEQAALSRSNAASYRAAIAALQGQ